MKKYLILAIILLSIALAETKLGAQYLVCHKDSPYVAEEGDHSIKKLQIGTQVRLIKDETVAEMAVLFPFRILKLMFTIEPRGNWLVEDQHGNRGYMWDSDLKRLK